MQMTITIDDEVFNHLEARALTEDKTVSQLIDDAVRLAAGPHGETAGATAFELVTFGKGGRFTSLNVDRVSALDAFMRALASQPGNSGRRLEPDARDPHPPSVCGGILPLSVFESIP